MCCANLSPTNMSDAKGGIWMFLTESFWVTMAWIAWSPFTRVEPIHVTGHIIPVTDNHGHTVLHRFAELGHASMIKEVLCLTWTRQNSLAEIISHDIVGAIPIIRRVNCLA